METSEIVGSIEWYVKSKNLSLKNALAIRRPMTIKTQEEHRLYYSQYFSSMLSITELLCDKDTPCRKEFKEKLYTALGNKNLDGSMYYGYLRELRNSIVHRGIHLTASAHIINNFPLLLAPNPVINRSGKQVYKSPEKYLLPIIKRLETVIPVLVVNHIKDSGWHNKSINPDEEVKRLKREIKQCEAMPEWVKQSALQSIQDIDMSDMHKLGMKPTLDNIEVNLALEIDTLWTSLFLK